MSNGSSVQCQPMQELEIHSILSRVEARSSELQERTLTIEGKLSSVLLQEPPQTAEVRPTSTNPGTPLGERLVKVERGLDEALDTLSRISRNIQV